MSDFIFTTERLGIRNLNESDFEAFHEMQSDDAVMKYVTDAGKGFSAETNRSQLLECISAYSKPENQFWVWAIVGTEAPAVEQFVGTCAIVKNEQEEQEIGYRFLRRWWGRGFGREICDPLIQYGLDGLGYREIVAYVDVRNLGSVRILDASILKFECEIQNGDVLDRKYQIQLA